MRVQSESYCLEMEIYKIQGNIVQMKALVISCLWNEITETSFVEKWPFSGSAYKDVQGHVDVFNGSFRRKDIVKYKV